MGSLWVLGGFVAGSILGAFLFLFNEFLGSKAKRGLQPVCADIVVGLQNGLHFVVCAVTHRGRHLDTAKPEFEPDFPVILGHTNRFRTGFEPDFRVSFSGEFSQFQQLPRFEPTLYLFSMRRGSNR